MTTPPPDRKLFISATGEKSVTLSGLPSNELVTWIDRRLGEDFTIEVSTRGRTDDTRWDLSERELSILRLISRGMSNQQIAAQLFLSLNTIKTYIRSIYRNIDVTTRPQAVLWGVRHGLDVVEDDPDETDHT